MGVLKFEDLPHYTYEEYITWEGAWELICGIPYAMAPAPIIQHQLISQKIARYLDEALESCKNCRALLPIDWKIDEDTIVQPDNLVICFEAENKAYITKAPAIIFEVLSKSTMMKDLNTKFSLYESEGVNYYIVVNGSERHAKVYALNSGHYVKVCDAQNDIVDFYLDECSFSFDFSKIWS